jgi:hypothetical protein
MDMEVKVGQGERDYFNGAIKPVATESSVLVSSSKYLNHAELRNLIVQEMLRRNGPDMPNTAYIPEVAQILMMLEDFPRVFELRLRTSRRTRSSTARRERWALLCMISWSIPATSSTSSTAKSRW